MGCQARSSPHLTTTQSKTAIVPITPSGTGSFIHGHFWCIQVYFWVSNVLETPLREKEEEEPWEPAQQSTAAAGEPRGEGRTQTAMRTG